MPEENHEHKSADKLASDRALMRWIIVACIGGAAYFGTHMLSRDNKHSAFLESSIIQTMAKLAENQAATLNNQANQLRNDAEAARTLEKLAEIAAGTQEWIKKFAIDQEHGVWRGRDPGTPAPAPSPMPGRPEQP